MHHDHCEAQDLAEVRAPIETARGLPSRCYTDPAAFAEDRQRLFWAGWSAIGFAADLPEPGWAVPVDHLGMPLLMVRDRAGQLRVFENVCRHRGMILVETPGPVGGVIRCPYHSWCYSLDGALRATPHVGGPGINRDAALAPETLGLVERPAGVFLGTVFANPSGTAPPFADWIAPLAARWADFAERTLYPTETFALSVDCNWKLAVENYCESYHLPWVHPGLNSYSRLEDHYNIVGNGFSGQGTRVYDPTLGGGDAFPVFPDLPARWDRAAEYVALFPNVLLGVHKDHAFAIRLAPDGPGRTEERVALFHATEEAAGPGWAAARGRAAALWRAVFEEDIAVVEGMQRGRHAPGFDGGRFSPAMDQATHHFHAWVAERLG